MADGGGTQQWWPDDEVVQLPDGTAARLATLKWQDIRTNTRKMFVALGCLGLVAASTGLVSGGPVWLVVPISITAAALGWIDGEVFERKLPRWFQESFGLPMQIVAAQRRRSLVSEVIALAVLLAGELWLVREMVRAIDDPAVPTFLTGVGTLAATGALAGDFFTRRAIDRFEALTGWRLGRIPRPGKVGKTWVGATYWRGRIEPDGLFTISPPFPKADGTPWADTDLPPLARQTFLHFNARYDDASRLGRELFKLTPDMTIAYNVACSLARAGDSDAALAWLGTSVELGWYDHSQLRRDVDLATVRHRPELATLIKAAKVNARRLTSSE